MKTARMTQRMVRVFLFAAALLLCMNAGTGTAMAAKKKVAASKLRVVSASRPDETVMEGTAFTIRGKIKSNYKILKVRVGVYDAEGARVSQKVVKPNTKTFDLAKVDPVIRFGKAQPGVNYYRIYASDEHKKLTCLLEAPFTVKPVPYPEKKNRECVPVYTNRKGRRSAAAYNRVINQFQVESRGRYRRDSNGTYCNIFAWDVMSAMGTVLPHWLLGEEPADSRTKGALERNANQTFDWLARNYAKYGWKKVNAAQAQSRANHGYPTFAIWRNNSGGAGHEMVVRPEGQVFRYSAYAGPVIAQAGATNRNYWNIRNTLGDRVPVYYTHD